MALDVSEAAEILTGLAEGLGLDVVTQGRRGGPDLILLSAGGQRVLVQIKTMSAPTPAQVSHLVADEELRARPDALHVVAADRIPAATRAELRRHGWGWLDLRGHLHLAWPGLFVDAEVPAANARTERADPFSGSVGVEVACTLLLDPDARQGVRDLARRLNRSASAVSEVVGAFRRQGLVGSDGTAVVPNLFWETAGAWQIREVDLADLPGPGSGSVNAALQLGFDDVETQQGWALTGTLAAAAYGAPVAARSDYPPDFYVPDPAILRRATRLLGQAVDSVQRRASVRVAPVRAICEQRVDPAGRQASTWSSTNEHWPLARPLFVALDLARDPGRGREILDGWQPPQPWQRVW
jgi:hypothetical protein